MRMGPQDLLGEYQAPLARNDAMRRENGGWMIVHEHLSQHLEG